MTASFARLLDEHDEIGRSANALLAAVTSHPPAGDAITLLAGLAETIAGHVAYEDSFIYPELERTMSADLSETAQLFAAEFAALRGDWTAYLESWPAPRIAEDWPGFGAATATIIPRMLDRMRRENECLYPLALRRGAVRLR